MDRRKTLPHFYRNVLTAISLGITLPALAQISDVSHSQGTAATVSNLPDAPVPAMAAASPEWLSTPSRPATPAGPARKYHRVVQANQIAGPLTVGDKLKLSVVSRFSLGDVGATVFSAGFSQLDNGKPHYGTDSGAFGERVGALALKQTTQSVFSYGIYASIFHDDPRYYVMGRSRGFATRALYSASRLLITRTDNGGEAPNWPKLAGIISSTALTNAYYPTVDHGFGNGAEMFGTSLGTSILDNELHEFLGDALHMVRHKEQ